jgi:endoglucanase
VRVRLYPRASGSPSDGLAARLVGYDQEATGADAPLSLTLDDPSTAGLLQPGDFGIWDLPHFALQDGFIHARAIDDLVGCAAMLLTLWQAAKEGWETDLYAVFTRAEEVGLVGAYVVLQSGVLPRDGIIVSLEASPALPGAVQGAGPVIRVGDRMTTFSQDAELILKAAAYRLGSPVWQPSRSVPPADAQMQVQRQLMSKGACEATAAIMLGYQATGLAMPLGNYHNMGEDSRLMLENISADDYLTGVTLLGEAARLMPELDGLRAEHYTAIAPPAHQVERLRETLA